MRRGATWRETPLTAPNALEHPRSCADTRLRNQRALQQPPRSPSDPQTPLATFGRFRKPNQPETPQYASVFPGRQSRRRTTPAENRTEVQDPWRNRRPFPPEPPRSRRVRLRARPRQPRAPVRAQPEASRGRDRRRSRGSPCACGQTNACTGCATNHRAKALMENAGRARTRPYKKQVPCISTNPPKSHP